MFIILIFVIFDLELGCAAETKQSDGAGASPSPVKSEGGAGSVVSSESQSQQDVVSQSDFNKLRMHCPLNRMLSRYPCRPQSGHRARIVQQGAAGHHPNDRRVAAARATAAAVHRVQLGLRAICAFADQGNRHGSAHACRGRGLPMTALGALIGMDRWIGVHTRAIQHTKGPSRGER